MWSGVFYTKREMHAVSIDKTDEKQLVSAAINKNFTNMLESACNSQKSMLKYERCVHMYISPVTIIEEVSDCHVQS